MGYYTRYSLSYKLLPGCPVDQASCEHENEYPPNAKFCPVCGVSTKRVSIKTLIRQELSKAIESGEIYGIDADGETGDAVKWYDHEKAMSHLSKKFPRVLFTLEGEGEESGDIWNKYFVNGKYQVAKVEMIFEPFDESKLKNVPNT